MNSEPDKSPKRVLEPYERLSEVLFGLIMVITITGSVNAAQAGKSDLKTMLWSSLGCNFAWGVADGIFYLMASLADRGSCLQKLKRLRRGNDPRVGQKLIADALPPIIAGLMRPDELESIRQRLLSLPEPPDRARLRKDDYLGATGVFLIVFLSTFPVVVPFIFMHHPALALRVSHLVSLLMLFLVGCAYGRVIGRKPWPIGIAMVCVGAALAGLCILLGG